MKRSIRRKGKLIQKVIKNSFIEAKNVIDKMDTSDIFFYAHNNSNRVVYEREKS